MVIKDSLSGCHESVVHFRTTLTQMITLNRLIFLLFLKFYLYLTFTACNLDLYFNLNFTPLRIIMIKNIVIDLCDDVLCCPILSTLS